MRGHGTGRGQGTRRLRRVGYSISTLVGVAVVSGIAGHCVTHTAIEQTETTEFCTSCHVMDAVAFQEFKETSHHHNPSGFRATCGDCHVPDAHVPSELTSYVLTKVAAVRFLYGWATGRVSEPEQLHARREILAERVWDQMRATDSRACRHCHDEAAMDLARQSTRAREEHLSGKEEGQTCIDCHDDGVAHRPVERAASEPEEDFTLD